MFYIFVLRCCDHLHGHDSHLRFIVHMVNKSATMLFIASSFGNTHGYTISASLLFIASSLLHSFSTVYHVFSS